MGILSDYKTNKKGDGMFEDVLREQNPHWSGQRYDQGVVRQYFSKIVGLLSTGMIISILGVRRSGKSTLLKQMINHLLDHHIQPQNILFINVEHPFFVQYAKDVVYLQKIYEEYLKIAAPTGKVYVLLDEIQFFDHWQVFVKALYEQKNTQFIITGSNAALLSADCMTLLSGRTLTVEVMPLSFKELVAAHTIDTTDKMQMNTKRHQVFGLFDQYMEYGGFPGVVVPVISAGAYEMLNAYAKTILYQDVAPRLQLRKSVELERLFIYLISNVGKPFSYANLSSLFDLTDKATKEYIGAFGDSYVLFELNEFNFSLKKQMRSPKKVYAIDVGQINAAAFRFSENKGRILENLVFLELKRLGLEVYYYKTKNDLEIDFLVRYKMRTALVQAAWDIRDLQTAQREQRALVQAAGELGLEQGLILTYDQETQISEDGIGITAMSACKFFCLSDEEKIAMLHF